MHLALMLLWALLNELTRRLFCLHSGPRHSFFATKLSITKDHVLKYGLFAISSLVCKLIILQPQLFKECVTKK